MDEFKLKNEFLNINTLFNSSLSWANSSLKMNSFINTLFNSSSMDTHKALSTLNLESAMELCRSNRFLSILSDPIKLVSKNRKLIALVALLSVFLTAIFASLFAYSVQSLVRGMLAAIRQPLTPKPHSHGSNGRSSSTLGKGPDLDNLVRITYLLRHLREDAAFLFAVQVAFILAFSTISFFSTISTILVSYFSYDAKNPSPKELISTIYGSWRRPLITSLYISALSSGYFATIAVFASPLWIYPDLPTFWLGVMVVVPSFIFYFYLLVSWILSVVVAVAEESFYRLEALGRAKALVKGKRLHCFLLNMSYGVLVSIIFQFHMIKMGEEGLAMITLMLVMSVSCLVRILLFVAYTVFYFHCKMHHGEEIELHASLQYTKVSSVVLP